MMTEAGLGYHDVDDFYREHCPHGPWLSFRLSPQRGGVVGRCARCDQDISLYQDDNGYYKPVSDEDENWEDRFSQSLINKEFIERVKRNSFEF
jgi:hypothetical protein